ncbi:uncharacterized protein LOC142321296 [Lycorma delicatula]|uniref:uncharacterized protein LOC142321296 n=1 Tax=Lycorma delicatula TaxID=130591 RepID=UPI003F519E1C
MAATFIFDSLWINIAIIFAVLYAIIYIFSAYRFTYWKNNGIPYISGTFPFGSIGNLICQKTSLVEIFLDFYNKAKNEKYIGFYSFLEPQIMIKDLAIIKNVLVKDFSNFVDRGVYFNEAVDPLSAHLFALEGLKWKNLRAKLSPTFTSGKMKMMFPTAKECAVELNKYVEKLSSKSDIDFKDVTGRYGLDVISSVALGLEGNNFKNENTDLRKVASMFSAPSTLQMFRITLTLSAKFIAKLMQIRFVPKAVEDYYMHVVKESTEYRENNNIKRDDFMQLLIELKNNKEFQNNGELKKDNQVNLTLEEMAAQSFVFVAAGFETTSVTLGFCLYELALNPHVQDKLIDELDEAGSDLSYDVLHQLPYLDMVISETLRKYPPVPTLQRQCLKDYTLPDGKIIKKGTLFVISVIGMHRDPKLFPNPEEFDPERFSKENIHKIQPYSYVPFGEGPRICIGMRFGKMQIKLAIASLLSRFRFETSVRTPIPVKIEKKTFTYNAEGGMWLQVTERKKTLTIPQKKKSMGSRSGDLGGISIALRRTITFPLNNSSTQFGQLLHNGMRLHHVESKMAVSFIFDGLWVNIAIIFAVLFAIIYVFSVYRFTYWKNNGIPYISGTFPFGSIGNLIFQKTSLVEIFLDFYNKARNEKYIGFYSFFEPQIVIKDLAIIKDVLVKDFSNFVDRGVYLNEAVDPLSAHLFALEGLKWKNLRAKLSPTFTSGKMKMMFPTTKECAEELKKYVEKLSSKSDIIDFKDVTGRYGLDVISSVALGLEGNNFKNENTDLRKVANMVSAPSTLQMLRITLSLSAKFIAKLMQMRFVPKAVEDYYMYIVKENTKYRENNNIKRDDFMQLLIDLKNNKEFQNNGELKKDNQVNLTLEEMAAQSFVFVAAGFETTSVTLGFCLYELALNPHIQDKLIDELDEVGSDLSYDVLNQLPYLDMVISETLRKYPPVPTLQRQSLKDYTLPGGKITKKGTLFVISVIGMHQDPNLFPNPEEFDPERFSKENIHKIQPYSYLPFGEGPRICIGMRFGKMQIKLALASLLSQFRFETSVRTPIPFKIEKKTFTYNAEGGMWLQVIQRKK